MCWCGRVSAQSICIGLPLFSICWKGTETQPFDTVELFISCYAIVEQSEKEDGLKQGITIKRNEKWCLK